MGLPGTGIFYTTTFPGGSGAGRGSRSSAVAPPPSIRAEDRLTLGFFKRLITPDDEKALVDGCREVALGNEEKAFQHLERAIHLADGAYLAGFLALKKNRVEKAARYLAAAAEKRSSLGRYFAKYGISAVMNLPVTDEITAHVGPDLRGVLLGLVEAYQCRKRWEDAGACLERLRRLEPGDVVVKLSLAELLLEARSGDKDACRRIVRLGEGIENETSIHAALMLYKARALRRLGLATAARDTLTAALRRKKDRSRDLLNALRYERARVYEDLGQKSRARADFERLYAEAPDYEDVVQRLGL